MIERCIGILFAKVIVVFKTVLVLQHEASIQEPAKECEKKAKYFGEDEGLAAGIPD